METLEVVASFDWLEKEETIGYLSYDQLGGKDVFTFEYTKEWIKNHSDIILGGVFPKIYRGHVLEQLTQGEKFSPTHFDGSQAARIINSPSRSDFSVR